MPRRQGSARVAPAIRGSGKIQQVTLINLAALGNGHVRSVYTTAMLE